MALVAYSDSEDSDSESKATPAKKPTPAQRPTLDATSASFAIDRSNTRKIRVNLDTATEPTANSRDGDDGPIAKRPRTRGDGLAGFNSMLPAPRRENLQAASSPNGQPARRVFSLRTGAEPGFSRELDAEMRHIFAKPDPTPITKSSDAAVTSTSPVSSDPSKIGNPMMFKPLSVARNPDKKKKPTIPREIARKAEGSLQRTVAPAPVPAPEPPKVSLFSTVPDAAEVQVSKDYEEEDGDPEREVTEPYENAQKPRNTSSIAAHSQSQSLSLDTIASDLHLSAADRRQLFGRNGKSTGSAINVINFNTDQEYAANEVLRSNGEQVQHNPVRGIAPGKHSLKQLMNAASTQKDALEESFATGKRNKREAGNRYGW